MVTISKIMDGERPDRPQEPDLTDPIWELVCTCWHQDPAHRPEMAKVVGILREWPHQQNAPAAVVFCGSVATDRHRHTPLVHSAATVTQHLLTAAQILISISFPSCCGGPNIKTCDFSGFKHLIHNQAIILLFVKSSNHAM